MTVSSCSPASRPPRVARLLPASALKPAAAAPGWGATVIDGADSQASSILARPPADPDTSERKERFVDVGPFVIAGCAGGGIDSATRTSALRPSAAESDSAASCERAVQANPDEAAREHVQAQPTKEFLGRERHGPQLTAASVISSSET